MSDYTTNATVNLSVNGQRAVERLQELRQQAMNLSEAISKAAVAGDKVELKRLRKELTAVRSEMRNLESSAMQVEEVLRRMDTATPKELERTLKTLYQQLEYIERGTEGWDKHVNKIQLVEREIDAVRKQIKTTHDVMQQTMSNLGTASIAQMETTLRMLQADLKQLIPGSRAWDAQKQKIDMVKNALDKATQAANINGVAIKKALINIDTASIRDLETALQQLEQKMKGLNRNDPAWGQTKRNIEEVRLALNEARTAATQMHDVMKLKMSEINKLTPRELTMAIQQLKDKMQNVAPNTKEWEKMRTMMERLKIAAQTSDETITKTMRHLDTASPERLKTTLDMLQKQLQQMRVGSAAWDAQTKKINQVKAALDRAKVAMQMNGEEVQRVLRNLSAASPKELERTLQALTQQMEQLRRGSQAWEAHVQKIKRVKAELASLRAETSNQMSLWERFNKKLNDWQMSIMGFIATFSGLIFAGRRAVNSYAAMEEEMANTRKYTRMTVEEVEKLNDSFKNMNTRLGRDKLNELAQEAGRLGKNTLESVKGYVEAASIINVALVDLGEGATQTIAKIANIFGIEEAKGTKEAMLSVGSAVNTVSQNCTASKQYLVEFTQRMAGVGAQADMTVPQILAFGATLDANGQKVEMSASAVSRLVMKIYQDIEGVAKSVGLNVNYFTKVMKENAFKGVMMFLEQIHKLGAEDGMAALGPMFKDLGMDGIRMAQVLATLADHLDMVKWEVGEATTAFNQASSATKEYEIFNNTTQAEIDKAKWRIHELAIELGEKLLPAYKHIMTSGSAFLRVLNVMVDFVKKYYRELIGLTAAVVSYKLVVNASNIALRAHYTWLVLTEATTKALKVGQLLAAAAWALCTGNIQKATAAMRLFNTVSKKNAIGLVVAGLIAAGTALYSYIQRQKEAAEAERRRAEEAKRLDNSIATVSQRIGEETSAVTRLRDAILRSNEGSKERHRLVSEWNSKYGRYMQQLLTEKSTAEDLALAYERVCQQLRSKAILEAKEKDMAATVDKRMGWFAQRLEEYDKINRQKKGGESAINSTWLKERVEELYSGNTVDQVIYKIHQEMNKSVLARIGKTLKEKTDNAEWAGSLYDAATAAVRQYFSMRYHENEVNKKWAPFAKDIAAGEEETSETNYPTFSGQSDDSGKSKKTERFKEEKEWLELQEALARIAYAKGVDNYDEYQRKLASLQVEYEQKILDRQDLSYQERMEHLAAYYDARDGKAKVANERTLEEEERYYREGMAQLKQRYVDGEMTTKEYNEAVEMAELQHLSMMRSIHEDLANLPLVRWEQKKDKAEREGKEFTDPRPEINRTPEYEKFLQADAAYQEALVNNQKKRIAIYEAYEKEHAETLKKIKASAFGDNPDERLSKFDEQYEYLKEVRDMELRAAGSNAKERLRIEKAFLRARKQLAHQYNIDYNKGFIHSWKKGVEQSAKWLESDGGKALMGSLDVVVSGMSACFSALTDIVQTELDIQTNALEKRYDAEISAAEGNNYKVKKLEKEKAAEEARLKKEANRKMFAMQVTQAIAQTAQGALAAYASAAAIPITGWIMAPIAASLAVAAGALQIAAIKKQQQASESTGYMQGGFTPKGRVDEEVGVVHAGEWVASQALVNNPAARPLINALDYAQRTNTIGSLRPSDVSRSITAPQVIAANTGNDAAMVTMAAAMGSYSETMRRLNQRLNEPFVTVNTVTGDTGIKRAQDEYEQLMRNKTPKSRRM